MDEYKKSISSVGVVAFMHNQWKLKFPIDKYGGESLGTFDLGPHGEIIEITGNIHDNAEH